jgi:hypothetical protein
VQQAFGVGNEGDGHAFQPAGSVYNGNGRC